MSEWIKIYEEPILSETCEDFSKYRIWLNEILEDEAITYKVEIKKVSTGVSFITFEYDWVIEFYVYPIDTEHVKELINEYNNSNELENCAELNVSEDDI